MTRPLLFAALALLAAPAMAADNGIYLGAGIGLSNVTVDEVDSLPAVDEDDTGFKVIAGIRPLDWLDPDRIRREAAALALDVEVLTEGNAARYWAGAQAGRHHMLLDLTHELTQDLGHGLRFRLRNAQSGLPALARVLERWVAHLLGVQVRIEPVQRIDDAQWRWHVGLDAESTALLNDLYEERPVDDERRRRLISLFRLDFTNPAEMHAEVAGRPVYLGLASNAEGVLRLKPQNLLINLPLARAS
jgi:hypothetical protein